jgi:hypothetical protein
MRVRKGNEAVGKKGKGENLNKKGGIETKSPFSNEHPIYYDTTTK